MTTMFLRPALQTAATRGRFELRRIGGAARRSAAARLANRREGNHGFYPHAIRRRGGADNVIGK
jgi:hypothetical protein